MKHSDQTESTVPHTPEPWNYDMDFIVASDPTGQHPDIYIAEIAHSDDEGRIAPYDQHQANSSRIVAAVNACAGIPTEALEQGIVAELLQQLSLLVDHLESRPHDLSEHMCRLRVREARAVHTRAMRH